MKIKYKNWLKERFVDSARLSALLAIIVAIFGVIAVTISSVTAYGPVRDGRSFNNPYDHITFNNYIDSPAGDERNFFVVKPASHTSSGGWQDRIKVEDGQEYIGRVYVHNNAAENLNLVAENTRVEVAMGESGGKEAAMTAYITADNAEPQKIWDNIWVESDQDFHVQYINGSALIENNGYAAGGGKQLPDALVSGGTKIGYSREGDGKVPGCFQYASYITFRFKVVSVKQPDFTMDKHVRVGNDGEWQKSVVANPGDDLQYRIYYHNTGGLVQNNVVAKDNLPKGIDYQSGTTSILNVNHPDGFGMKTDDALFSEGKNIGNYTPNSNGAVFYNAKVNPEGLVCGANDLVNEAAIETNNGRKRETATVVVNVECQEPVEVCDIESGGVVQIEKDNFDENKYSHNLDDCKKIEVCEISSGQVISIRESEFDSSRHSQDLSDCQTTPTALPTTGPAEVVLGILAAGLLAGAAVYYFRSRNDLKKAMAGEDIDFAPAKKSSVEKSKTEKAEAKSSKKSSAAKSQADKSKSEK